MRFSLAFLPLPTPADGLPLRFAGLTLVRIAQRNLEVATRMALGASRRRVLWQLWIENLLLALTGGAAGLGLAIVLMRAARKLLPDEMVPLGGFGLDSRVLAFTAAAAVLTSLLFGALPALQTRKLDLRLALAAGTRAVANGPGRIRQWLIGGEVALTVVLLAGAGLLVRTLVHLETLPPGFDATNVMTAKASLTAVRYNDPITLLRLLDRSVTSLQRIPGVEEAAAGLSVPYERGLNYSVAIMDGPQTGRRAVSGDLCTSGSDPRLGGRCRESVVSTIMDSPHARPFAAVDGDHAASVG